MIGIGAFSHLFGQSHAAATFLTQEEYSQHLKVRVRVAKCKFESENKEDEQKKMKKKESLGS